MPAHRLMVPASQDRVSVMVRLTILGILSKHSVQYTAWLSADTFRNLNQRWFNHWLLDNPEGQRFSVSQPVLWSKDHGNSLLRTQSTLITDHACLKHNGSHWPSCHVPHLVISVHPDIDPVHRPHLGPALGAELVPGPHLGLPGRPLQAGLVTRGLHSREPAAAVLLVVLRDGILWWLEIEISISVPFPWRLAGSSLGSRAVFYALLKWKESNFSDFTLESK